MEKETQTMRPEMAKTCRGGRERNSRWPRTGVSSSTARRGNSHPGDMQLMEAVVARENMVKALYRVERNKGASGVDNMTTGELRSYLKVEWPRIKEELLAGRYKPQPVRRVEIPKAGGGMRALGIPTVVDRLIQQALHQVLSPLFDPEFSQHSYGFRPGRSAHMAVNAAQRYVQSSKRWVVDMDVEKFFDRVNHDILIARIARKAPDKRVLALTRGYLQSGVMVGGLATVNRQGTPQGGPLSPLLSNIVLDELDRELERRGHRFCRYADDCNIYVGSRKAGERVMISIARFLREQLQLTVNRAKSAVDRPWRRKFLGYSMTFHTKSRLKVATESVKRLMSNLKELFRAGRGRNLARFIKKDLNPVLRGWVQYFQLSEVKGIFDELDGWIRRRLRCVLWRQGKRARTRAARLMARGLVKDRALKSAFNGRGAWWNSGAAHMNEAFPKKYFGHMGLVSLLDELHKLQGTS
jgi:RNA-directed DNA polymerase